jgi:hypothetical protein
VIFNEAEMSETAVLNPAETLSVEEEDEEEELEERKSELLSEIARGALNLLDLDSIDEEAPIAASMRSADAYSN